MKGKGEKMPVTIRALVQRINRKIAVEFQQLKRMRGGVPPSLKRAGFFTVDLKNNTVSKTVDLETYARQIGVLKPWEKLVE